MARVETKLEAVNASGASLNAKIDKIDARMEAFICSSDNKYATKVELKQSIERLLEKITDNKSILTQYTDYFFKYGMPLLLLVLILAMKSGYNILNLF